MMLDVARTWMEPAALKRYVDLLSYHGINKLHLRLLRRRGVAHRDPLAPRTGRRGRIPRRRLARAPRLRQSGTKSTAVTYTQEQMRELIAYAALRNIEIIPEIDLPGHSRCIASVRPEIRCDYPADTASTNGYDYRSAWCVAREENYALLEDILGELCALFPSEYIHIGGDEVDAAQWQRCPDCRALMRQRGSTTRTASKISSWSASPRSSPVAASVPPYGTKRSERAPSRATAASTAGESVKACLAATEQGYPTVVMPGESFYFDMRQIPTEEGHDWAAIFDARKTFGFDLAARGFTPERMRHVVGLQGAFFSEAYIGHEPEKPDYIDYMCFPRICALSRIAWSGNAEGWEAYYSELIAEHYDRMAAMGIRFRLFPPKIAYRDGVLSAETDDGSELFYLCDDDSKEHPYTQPLRTAQPHRYRFVARRGTGRSPYTAHKSYYRTIAPALTIATSMGRARSSPIPMPRPIGASRAHGAPAGRTTGCSTPSPNRCGAAKCSSRPVTGSCPRRSSRRDMQKSRTTAGRSAVSAIWSGEHPPPSRPSREGRAARLHMRRQRHSLRHPPTAADQAGAVTAASIGPADDDNIVLFYENSVQKSIFLFTPLALFEFRI